MQTALAIYHHPEHQTLDAYVPATANDEKVIAMWLHGKASKTRTEYRRDLKTFQDHVGSIPLRAVTLDMVQGFVTSLEASYKPRTVCRKLAAVKSLLSFAAKIGYTHFNVGAPVKGPKPPQDLAKRILSEEQVMAMITQEPNTRNRALLKLLYVSGARAAEAHGLTWGDCAPNADGTCTLMLFGKGSKTRHVVIPAGVWLDVAALRPQDAGDDDPVFLSRKHNPLSTVQIWRVVRAAADRVGINKNVSPHWMRHACASHALQRGCNVAVVQATLGHSSLAVTSVYVHVKPSDSAGLYLAVG